MLSTKIAGVKIGFSGFKNEGFLLERFTVLDAKHTSFRFILDGSPPPGFALSSGIGYYNGRYPLFFSIRDGACALLEEEGRLIRIFTPDVRKEKVSNITAFMLSICLLKYDALMMHAALVDIDGEGLLFIGRSGIGKTTQAEQWARHRGALIINGDNTFVRKQDGEFWAHGSPWHGSSPYCENRKTKLRAIVALEQSPFNRIERLMGLDAVLRGESNVFLPGWRKENMAGALAVFDDLLAHIPLFLLECRVDREAVDMTYSAVFGVQLNGQSDGEQGK